MYECIYVCGCTWILPSTVLSPPSKIHDSLLSPTMTLTPNKQIPESLSEEVCRCCYDPNSDGGEYRSLIQFKAQKLLDRGMVAEWKNNEQDQRQVETIALEEKFGDDFTLPVNDIKDAVTTKVSDDNDDDDEFDYLLDEDLPGEEGEQIRELEDARRAELEYQLLLRQMATHHGYGVIRQLHPTRVLKVAGLGRAAAATASGRPCPPPPPSAVVLHLVDPDSIASASLDYYFETELARKNLGTMFLRSGGRSTLLLDPLALQSLPPSISDPEQDIPALVAIKDGVVIQACPRLHGLTTAKNRHGDDDNKDGEVEPYAVQEWLDRCGVLLQEPPRMDDMCTIRPEEDALLDYLSTTQPMKQKLPPEEYYDCGMEGCHKPFKHEHVGIETSRQSGLVVQKEIIIGKEDQEDQSPNEL
jgi:hypothetical protein